MKLIESSESARELFKTHPYIKTVVQYSGLVYIDKIIHTDDIGIKLKPVANNFSKRIISSDIDDWEFAIFDFAPDHVKYYALTELEVFAEML